jgi:hypothetical protein
MKKIILSAVAVLFVLAGSSYGQLSWVGNGYAILNITNTGNAYYDLDAASGNPDFDSDNSSAQAYSLTITINQGDSLKLGGQNQTWDANYTVTTSYLEYRVSTGFSGTFNALSLPYWKTESNNDWWDTIQGSGSLTEIGSSLAQGTYYLEIYQRAFRDPNTAYHNEADQSGNNWEARIIVVPEPSSIMLVVTGLASLALLRRRQR